MRSKAPESKVINALQEGVDTEGGFLVPDEFEHTLIEALEDIDDVQNVYHNLDI